MSQVKGFFILFCPPADSGPPAQTRSYLLRSGRNHRSLWGPFLCLEPPAIIHHARLQPFLDQANDPLVSDPMLHELDHPIVPDFVEKRLDVQIQRPVHFLLRDPDIQRVQRFMLAALRPEPVPKTQKVLFPDLVENCPYRTLGDLVFQRLAGSRPSATVSPDSPHYGFAHAGRLAAPPGLLHILATSCHPLPPPLASSGCSSCCAADQYCRGAVYPPRFC